MVCGVGGFGVTFDTHEYNILLLSAKPPKDVKHPPEPLEDRGSGFAF